MGDEVVDLSKENDGLKNEIDKRWLEESKAKLSKQIDDEKRANLKMSRMTEQWKNFKKTYISYNKLWNSEFVNIFSKRDKLQDLKIKQSKLGCMILMKKMKK